MIGVRASAVIAVCLGGLLAGNYADTSAALGGSAAADPADARGRFQRILADAGLQFRAPPGFLDLTGESNPVWPYEHAVRSADGALEIRYAIRPIDRVEIRYDDPHSSAPSPDHIFPMVFQTLIEVLSERGHTPSREYPPQQARDRFNADWAAAALFDTNPHFAGDYHLTLLLAMHKSGLADAYAIFLFNDYDTAKPLIDAHLDALRFVD